MNHASHYEVFLNLDAHKKNFQGNVTITFENKSDKSFKTPAELYLDSCNCVILKSVLKTDDSELKGSVSYVPKEEKAKFTFEQSLSVTNGKFELQITYVGQLNKINTFGDSTRGVFITNYLDEKSGRADNHIIATQCQPNDCRRIFPCLDSDSLTRSTIKLSIKTHSKFTVRSNTAVESEQLKDDFKIVHFKETLPMVISLFGFVCGDFEATTQSLELYDKQIQVSVYTLIGKSKSTVVCMNSILNWLPVLCNDVFKSGFPVEKIDVVGLPFLTNGAVENWGLITILDNIISISNLEDSASISQLNQIIVHELVHQWIGNLMAFDSWHQYWLVEALVTFLTYEILNDNQFKFHGLDLNPDFNKIWIEQCIHLDTVFAADESQNRSIAEITESVDLNKLSSISEVFDKFTYEKAIWIFRTLKLDIDNSKDEKNSLLDRVSDFVLQNKFQNVHAIDFWSHICDNKSRLNMLVSHLRVPGFPIVSVSLDGTDVTVSQKRNESQEQYTYHVPLNIVTDSGVEYQILSASSIVLQTKINKFIMINAERAGYYKVLYEDIKFYENIAYNINKITKATLVGLLQDCESFIASSDIVRSGFIAMCKIFNANSSEICFEALEIVVRVLLYIRSQLEIENPETAAKLQKSVIDPLLSKINRSSNLGSNSYLPGCSQELKTLNQVFLSGVKVKEVSTKAQKLLQQLLHGPKHSVPKEVIPGILINVMYNCKDSGTYKKVLQLTTRSGEAVLLNVDNSFHLKSQTAYTSRELQTAALTSLGFVRSPDLFKKTLNHVTTNIDLLGIELALVGYNYFESGDTFKKLIWNWFKLHFDQWASRSLRQGSEYSEQLFNTFHSVFETIIAGFSSVELDAVESFIDSKKQFSQHEFDKVIEKVRKERLNLSVVPF